MEEVTRKEFFGVVTSMVVGGVLGKVSSVYAILGRSRASSGDLRLNNHTPRGILFDATRCIGCLACVKLCKEEHDLPPEIEFNLSARSLTVVQKKDSYFMRRLCMHCLTPSCVSVCPVGALEKLDYGAVIWHEERCIGCRYCMQACPFRVPTYEWWSRNPRVVKCDMCQHRVREGKEVACAWVCPLGATAFGARDELLHEARRRIHDKPGIYLDHIYGEREAGGTSTLFLLPVNALDFGLPENLGTEAFPTLTWQVMRKIPYIIGTGAILLGGLWWIINQRREVDRLMKEEEKRMVAHENLGPER